MINRVKLHNFKAFENLTVNLRPITLFLGPNNSGKSSILASIRLLSQTIESFDPQVVLLLDGIMGDFGTYKDIVYGNHRGRVMQICLSVQPSWRKPGELGLIAFWPSIKDKRFEIKLEYKYRTIRREIILKEIEVSVNNESLITIGYSFDSEKQIINQIGNKKLSPAAKSQFSKIIKMNNFLPSLPPHRFFPLRQEESMLGEVLTKNDIGKIDIVNRSIRMFDRELHNIDYIGAMRASPQRTYAFTGEKRGRIGPSGENAANIFVLDELRSGARKLNIAKNVNSWLVKAGMASNLQMEPISDRHYEIHVKHPVTGESQNLADVGYGNSQIFPVLVGGYNMQEGSTFIVEEPEIHLHPRAQAELGDFFLDLYKKGVQSIVETHSEYLILRLQQHVALGNIPYDRIRIYYVFPEGNLKLVKPLRLDKLGKFKDEWPEGFFPERLEEARKLAKIRFDTEIKSE
jgi:predicted ATPase